MCIKKYHLFNNIQNFAIIFAVLIQIDAFISFLAQSFYVPVKSQTNMKR